MALLQQDAGQLIGDVGSMRQNPSTFLCLHSAASSMSAKSSASSIHTYAELKFSELSASVQWCSLSLPSIKSSLLISCKQLYFLLDCRVISLFFHKVLAFLFLQPFRKPLLWWVDMMPRALEILSIATSVIFSHPDRSRWRRFWQQPSEDQLKSEETNDLCLLRNSCYG